ncbi:Ribonuclease H [Nymphaea thermarum]|nr:Ribonuclease H [Nymphaea thermarum]
MVDTGVLDSHTRLMSMDLLAEGTNAMIFVNVPPSDRSHRWHPYTCTGPSSDQARFRNRKLFVSQNVMAVVRLDTRFHYVLAGWEGSATDSRVLYSALDHETDPFVVPEGTTTKMMPRQKYYVVFEGRERGIYDSWERCQPLVYRYKGAVFKSFDSLEVAENHMYEYVQKKYGVQVSRPPLIEDLTAKQDIEDTNLTVD